MITVTKFKHENVNKDGTFSDGKAGAVEVYPSVRMSQEDEGGCGLNGCHCSDGHWIMISTGRDSYGTVEGMTVHFESKEYMDRFFRFKELIG